MARFICPRCGQQDVSPTGSTIVCKNCINQFLLKHVGAMQEMKEPETPEILDDRVPVIKGNPEHLVEHLEKRQLNEAKAARMEQADREDPDKF